MQELGAPGMRWRRCSPTLGFVAQAQARHLPSSESAYSGSRSNAALWSASDRPESTAPQIHDPRCWNISETSRQNILRQSESVVVTIGVSGQLGPSIHRLHQSGRARSNALQYIVLIPEWDVVLVLTTDMDRPGWMNWLRNRMGMQPDLEDVTAVLLALNEARPR